METVSMNINDGIQNVVDINKKIASSTHVGFVSFLPRYVTFWEFRALKEAAGDVRARLLLELIYHLGLGVEECRGIRLPHIKRTRKGKILIIMSKIKRKRRSLRIRRGLWELIQDLTFFDFCEQDFLFRSRKGRALVLNIPESVQVRAPISARRIREIVKKTAKDAGIPDYSTITPTALRYGYVVLAITKRNKRPRDIERLLGLRHDPRRVKMYEAMANSAQGTSAKETSSGESYSPMSREGGTHS
jgi:integrase